MKNPARPIPPEVANTLSLTRGDEIAIGYWRSHPDATHPEAGGNYARSCASAVKRGDTVRQNWAGPRAKAHSRLPWPGDHIDPTMPTAERERVAEALDAAPIVATYRGFSNDRLDPESRTLNGSGDRALGGYRWPEGLSLYVRKYGLRLDPTFLSSIGA